MNKILVVELYTWKLCMHDYYSKKNFRKLFNSKLSRSSLLPWCYVLELRVYCSDPGTYMSRSCLYQDTRPPPSITKQLKDRSVNTVVISLWHRSEWLLVLALVALPVVCGDSFCRFLSISRLWYDNRQSLHLNHQQYPFRFPYTCI